MELRHGLVITPQKCHNVLLFSDLQLNSNYICRHGIGFTPFRQAPDVQQCCVCCGLYFTRTARSSSCCTDYRHSRSSIPHWPVFVDLRRLVSADAGMPLYGLDSWLVWHGQQLPQWSWSPTGRKTVHTVANHNCSGYVIIHIQHQSIYLFVYVNYQLVH